ncbi:MAG: FAD-binding oxidoreductase [Actinomycetota bacterium]
MRVSLLPVYDQQNGWQEILPRPAEATPLTGERTADYVVVGAGYSGLAACRRLAELNPDASVVLIEGDRIGNNAAGRSSGFAIDHAHNIRAKSFAENVEPAKREVALNREALKYLEDTIVANDIDCDWRREGKYHAAATAKGEKLLEGFAASLDAIDEDYSRHDQADLASTFGTDFYRSAIHAPHSYLVQPAAMVRGLADTMPDNVTVHESTMVTEVDFGPPHTLRTTTDGVARGSIATPNLVLATNGFVEGFGFFDRHLIPMITWGSMTRELTDDEVERLGGVDSYGIIAAHPAGTSVRRTADRRILIRNIFSYSRRSSVIGKPLDRARETHRQSFLNRYPMLADVPFEFTWGGALSLTRNGAPVFGELRNPGDGVWGTVVHNGVGIAKGTISGKLLAEKMCGHESDSIALMDGKGRPSRNFPEPFNSWGVRMNARWRRSQAGLEE